MFKSHKNAKIIRKRYNFMKMNPNNCLTTSLCTYAQMTAEVHDECIKNVTREIIKNLTLFSISLLNFLFIFYV